MQYYNKRKRKNVDYLHSSVEFIKITMKKLQSTWGKWDKNIWKFDYDYVFYSIGLKYNGSSNPIF